MATDESRNKKDVIDEARNKGRKVHFAWPGGWVPKAGAKQAAADS